MTKDFCEASCRTKRMRILPVFAMILLITVLTPFAKAGGPRHIGGSSYFDASAKGVPLTWDQGAILYYTDQGDLSPILRNADADAFVADSFSRWTSISTAAISASRAGQLSEDVNGTNVAVDAEGNITMPLDIQPVATDKPVAVVYDADGAITDALLGSGASAICSSNAVFGGVDNFSTDGHLVHAVVVMNGNCGQTFTQLPDMKYRLVRVLGRVLGLDWSQLNINAQTGNPRPTSDDYAGLPVMHQTDLYECVPISLCYPNADQPKMDDAAAISRLYPVTSQNLNIFPGKLLLAENTGRVHGSVRFVDAYGQPAQPMQGVNVVARWVDPSTNKPSHRYSISSVSGFLFRGNAGNPVTGFNDATGHPWNRFGSDDSNLEGLFDLAGLPFPDGGSTAKYELTVEALDPDWSQGAGPYAPSQVKPSGGATPMVVTVTKGGDLQQDILMMGSAAQGQDMRESESWNSPAMVPRAGDWIGFLSGYGDVDYYQFPGQAKRTLSIEVTALDEAQAASQDKARPVIGVWSLAAPPDSTPGAGTPNAFNSSNYGLTRLDAVLLGSTDFRIGIADERGDGRPDYRYHARVLYGDKVLPARIGVNGAVLGIRGMGFRPGMTVTVGRLPATLLSLVSDLIIVSSPAMPDGVQSIKLEDPSTGGSSILTDAITYGAAPDDSIILLSGSNPTTPVGAEAANPVRVRVVAANGIAPVTGASVHFTVNPAAALTACGGAPSCTVLTNENGEASTRVTPLSPGVSIFTASLAPDTYSPARYVQATINAQSSGLDIAVLSPYRWVAENATLDLPLVAQVLSNGAPQSGKSVTFRVTMGSADLNPASASSDSSGKAGTTVQIHNLSGQVQVSACVSPTNAPCAILTLTKVGLSNIKLRRVAGSGQMVGVGQAFQRVVVQATDASSPANPVQGAVVNFWQIVFHSDNDAFSEASGEVGSGYPMPIILSSSQSSVVSDALGLASLVPSAGVGAGAIEIEIMATAGTNAEQQFEVESIWTNVGVAAESPGGPGILPDAQSTAPQHKRSEKTGSGRVEMLNY